jgi:hypothetical protein
MDVQLIQAVNTCFIDIKNSSQIEWKKQINNQIFD